MAKNIVIPSLFVFSCAVFANQDPTAPLAWQQSTSAPVVVKAKKGARTSAFPVLQSIVCQSDYGNEQKQDCVAVLNDKLVSKGESINGYYVDAIQSQEVILSRKGKRWPLKLFSLDVK